MNNTCPFGLDRLRTARPLAQAGVVASWVWLVAACVPIWTWTRNGTPEATENCTLFGAIAGFRRTVDSDGLALALRWQETNLMIGSVVGILAPAFVFPVWCMAVGRRRAIRRQDPDPAPDRP